MLIYKKSRETILSIPYLTLVYKISLCPEHWGKLTCGLSMMSPFIKQIQSFKAIIHCSISLFTQTNSLPEKTPYITLSKLFLRLFDQSQRQG